MALSNPILATLGFVMIGLFMALVLLRRTSALVGLILLPILFGVLCGQAPQLGEYALAGVKQVAPTVLLIAFAILFFSTMIDAGLFKPVGKKIVAFSGLDPMRTVIGSAILSLVVAFSGDGITTALVVAATMIPLYDRLGLRRVVLGCILVLSIAVQNMSPWGGPAARAAAALDLDASAIYIGLLPTVLIGCFAVLGIAWVLGRNERRRLASGDGPRETPAPLGDLMTPAPSTLDEPPRKLVMNTVLTLGLLALMVSGLVPAALLFAAGYALAALLNYPDVAEQRRRFESHAVNVAELSMLVLGAGIFTGILSGTGMISAMSTSIISIIPDWLGTALAPIVAFLSVPLSFLLPYDAFFFGAMPIAVETGQNFGVDALHLARASLLGLPVHYLSPLVPGIYLLCSILKIDFGEYQRVTIPWAILLSVILIIAAMATGAFPILAGG